MAFSVSISADDGGALGFIVGGLLAEKLIALTHMDVFGGDSA